MLNVLLCILFDSILDIDCPHEVEATTLESEDVYNSGCSLIGENENSSVVTCFNHLTVSIFSHFDAIVMSLSHSSSFIVNEELLSSDIYANDLMVCLMAIFNGFVTKILHNFTEIIIEHLGIIYLHLKSGVKVITRLLHFIKINLPFMQIRQDD